MAVYTKKWNGTAWVTAPFKKWNGSAWVDAYVYKWDGSAWFQLYPEPAVTVTNKSVTGSNLTTYRTTWSSWDAGDAKQGNGSSYGGSAACYGYCGISASSFAGSGSISSVTKQQFSGTRGDAGTYNADQTIKFYRSSLSTSGSPTTSTIAGNFTATTGGPGKNAAISTKTISGSEFKNWLNQVGSKPYLYIYSATAADYLDLTAVKITASYTYTAAAALFTSDGTAVAYNMRESDYRMNGGETVYHKMPIYKDEMGLTLYEIMDRRDNGIVEDIDPTTVDYAPSIILPWFREREVFTDVDGQLKVKIEVNNMRNEDEVQYSLDKVNWFTLYGTGVGSYVQGVLPQEFNKYSDTVYIRILDKQQDIIIDETIIEPLIYIP